MNFSKNSYITALFLAFSAMTFIEIASALKGYEAESDTRLAWSLISLLLIALWVNKDSDDFPNTKPFELGFLIYIMWPITLPWYLISTRGIDGAIQTLGFISIFLLPWLLGNVAYVYSG